MVLAVHSQVALAPPRLSYSIYYSGQIATTPPTSVGHLGKTATQYAAEMNNLAQHGILLPSCYTLPVQNPQNPPLGQSLSFTLLDQEMTLRTAAGLPGRSSGGMIPLVSTSAWHAAYLSPPSGWTPAQVLADYDRILIGIIEHFSQADTADLRFPEPLFYGIDEAQSGTLLNQLPLYQKIHDKGGRSCASVYSGFHASMSGSGGLIDVSIMNIGHSISDILTDLTSVHADGHSTWSYHDPQYGIERPSLYRLRYGLSMWAKGLDGACDFAYQWKFGPSLWDDFDHPTYREHTMAYPTSSGVIDTIQWEGFREAVDDVRYLSTLQNLIDSCKFNRIPGNAVYDAGVREEAYVARLQSDLQAGMYGENRLQAIRAAIVRKIQTLQALNP